MDDILEKFIEAIDKYFENSPLEGDEREKQLQLKEIEETLNTNVIDCLGTMLNTVVF